MDLAWTQATWNKLFQRIGLVSSIYHLLYRIRDELRDRTIRVEEYADVNNHLGNWSFEGINLFENTDEKGLLYVKIIDAGGGDWTIEVYKDSGFVNKVAEGTTGAGIPATLVLVEANSSGITGSVDIGAACAAHNSVWLRPKVGILKQINDVPIDDIYDANFKVDLNRNLTTILTSLSSGLSRMESFTKAYLLPYIGQKIKTSENQVQNARESSSSNNITYAVEGILEAFIDAMGDDSIAGAQTIEIPAAGSSSTVEDGDNQGSGDFNSAVTTFFEYAENCLITFECTTETLGSETFSAVARRTEDGRRITAGNRLTVYKDYCSIGIGIKYAKLMRTISDAGAEANHFSNWIVYGVTADTSDSGILYCRISGTGTIVDFYSDVGRTTKVASGAIAAGVLTIAEYDDSGINGTADVGGGAPADGDDLEINLNPFSIGDKIYMTFTRTARSFFELFFGRIMKTELPGSVGAPTIVDAYSNRGYLGLFTEL